MTKLAFAAYLNYLGYPLLRTLVINRVAKWEFRIPDCDWEMCQQEWASDEPIQLTDCKKYAEATADLICNRNLAGTNRGEWVNKKVLLAQYS